MKSWKVERYKSPTGIRYEVYRNEVLVTAFNTKLKAWVYILGRIKRELILK